MLQRPKRRRRKRRLSLIITFIDFIIIFGVIFYIQQYMSKIKTCEYGDLKIKYKYDKLKDIGYIFSLNIINYGTTNIRIKKDNRVKFFIMEKESKKLIWEKIIPKPTFPMNLSKTDSIILKPDDHIGYTFIYNSQNEVNLPKGEWRFGSTVTIGTKKLEVSIPRSTKPVEGFADFFK